MPVIPSKSGGPVWAINPLPPAKHNVLESRKVFTIRSQTAMINNFTWQCCLNCDNWTKTSQKEVPDETKYSGVRLEQTGPKCMKFDILPPPEVILTGCEHHEDMIPF
jgi:hypothetical protein